MFLQSLCPGDNGGVTPTDLEDPYNSSSCAKTSIRCIPTGLTISLWTKKQPKHTTVTKIVHQPRIYHIYIYMHIPVCIIQIVPLFQGPNVKKNNNSQLLSHSFNSSLRTRWLLVNNQPMVRWSQLGPFPGACNTSTFDSREGGIAVGV